MRVIGGSLSTADGLKSALSDAGELSPLTISAGKSSIVITSASQATGEDQCVYVVSGETDRGIEVAQLAMLNGNTLDIDNWTADNFIIASSEAIA